MVTPFGAHPGGSPGLHAQDENHPNTYVAAGRDQASFDSHLADYVRSGAGKEAYANRVGIRTFAALSFGITAS